MCFVRISEQTATISLYSINWLDFIIACFYCAVRIESLNKSRIYFRQSAFTICSFQTTQTPFQYVQLSFRFKKRSYKGAFKKRIPCRRNKSYASFCCYQASFISNIYNQSSGLPKVTGVLKDVKSWNPHREKDEESI